METKRIKKDEVKYTIVENSDGAGTIAIINISDSFKSDTMELPSKTESGGINACRVYGYKGTKPRHKFDLVIPDTVKFIHTGSFRRWPAIRKLIVGKNVSYVGASVFKYNHIDEVYWPDENTYLDEDCFASTTIKRFIAGANLGKIDPSAFNDGIVEVFDFSNVLTDTLEINPRRLGVKEIIPPFYGKLKFNSSGYKMSENGIWQRC